MNINKQMRTYVKRCKYSYMHIFSAHIYANLQMHVVCPYYTSLVCVCVSRLVPKCINLFKTIKEKISQVKNKSIFKIQQIVKKIKFGVVDKCV